MDIMDMRAAITVISFIAFLGIVFWAYSSRQKERFDEAANLPFADEDMQQRTIQQHRESSNQSANDASNNSKTNTKKSNDDQGVTHG